MSTESGSRRRWWRWPLIGCGIGLGIVVAVVVAIVVILALIGLAVREEQVASDLGLGEPVTIDDIRVAVDRFEMSDSAGEEPFVATPAPGARFLWVHITAQNLGQVPVEERILVRIQYKGEEVGSPSVAYHGPGHPRFPSRLQLFPNIGSEGWRAFEVPVDLDLSEVAVVFQVGLVGGKLANWRLVEPDSGNGS